MSIGWVALTLAGQVARAAPGASAPSLPPRGVVVCVGDRSVLLHWEVDALPRPAGYHVERALASAGSYERLNRELITLSGWADLTVTNGFCYYYRVRAVGTDRAESAPSAVVAARPEPFADEEAFLDYVQRAAFDFFWYEANPANGLVRDRSQAASPCSIAAVGFGLTGLGVGIDHGWITRAAGRARVQRTLDTFWRQPQGPAAEGNIGYRGWFYHFLDWETGARAWKSELSSIDTALLLAGILYVREYFDAPAPEEVTLRKSANAILERVDWRWMAQDTHSLSHGWHPERGFIANRWMGYNEAMILYLLGLGTAGAGLDPACWETWCRGYEWRRSYGLDFVHFPPLFGHQYSHCWIDFRGIADAYMRARGLTYAENSRRAALAQRAYAMANPGGFAGYGSNVWGLTACDGPGRPPFHGYIARGAPPPENDDGTLAPTAAAASLPFAPEVARPAMRHFYDEYRSRMWTLYGFCDAFNLQADWWDPEVIGIDQGPILLMIENHRTGRVWQTMMKAPEIRRGLAQAGFRPVTDPAPAPP